jgi:hypothetical protein
MEARNMRNCLSLLLAAAAACSGCTPCIGGSCAKQPAVRPIDHACLPTGAQHASVPLYRGTVPDRTFVEIAYVDSFACADKQPPTVQSQMRDLQAKAGQAGADAVIRVEQLANKKQGLVDNPMTPFPSSMQDTVKEYFFRGVAVKFTGTVASRVER